MDWHFYYEGPKDPLKVEGGNVPPAMMSCVTCAASLSKQCPTHGQSADVACAHCIAAQGGPCRGHWGIVAALADHSVAEDAESDFDFAKKIVLEECASSKVERVRVSMRGDGHLSDAGHREIHIVITGR